MDVEGLSRPLVVDRRLMGAAVLVAPGVQRRSISMRLRSAVSVVAASGECEPAEQRWSSSR